MKHSKIYTESVPRALVSFAMQLRSMSIFCCEGLTGPRHWIWPGRFCQSDLSTAGPMGQRARYVEPYTTVCLEEGKTMIVFDFVGKAGGQD